MPSAVPKQMKAVFQTQPGSHDDVLQVGPQPTPSPQGYELLVQVHAVSINPVDYKVSGSRSKDGAAFRVGWDASGVVVGLGPEAKMHKIGDEVMFAGDVRKDGCHAEYTVIDERLVGRKPASLSHVEAAAMPLTALTAWEGLLENMAIPMHGKAGKSILVVGASGGVGSIAVQIAKNVLGLTVIGTASRDETSAWARSMGADYVIDHRKGFAAEFERLGLKPVDYVYNTANIGDNFAEIVSVVKPLAKWVNIQEPNKALDLSPIFAKRIQLSFEFMYARSMFDVEPIMQRNILNEVADLLDLGVLRTTLNKEMDLFRDIKEAHRLQKSGATIGKIGMRVVSTRSEE